MKLAAHASVCLPLHLSFGTLARLFSAELTPFWQAPAVFQSPLPELFLPAASGARLRPLRLPRTKRPLAMEVTEPRWATPPFVTPVNGAALINELLTRLASYCGH